MPHIDAFRAKPRLEDWDESPVTEQEIEDEAHKAGWTPPAPALTAANSLRYCYGVSLALLVVAAILFPDARWYAVIGLVGALIYLPTFERSLK